MSDNEPLNYGELGRTELHDAVYRAHPTWSRKDFYTGCADVEMCRGMSRLAAILRRYRNPQPEVFPP